MCRHQCRVPYGMLCDGEPGNFGQDHTAESLLDAVGLVFGTPVMHSAVKKLQRSWNVNYNGSFTAVQLFVSGLRFP